MAKIKIQGINEMLDIPNEEAENVKNMKADGRKEDVTINGCTFSVSDVRFIKMTDEASVTENKSFEDWVAKRDERLSLSLEERSQQCHGNFTLFFWMLTGKKPSESQIEQSEISALAFFKKNPLWSFPSVKWWLKSMGITKEDELKQKFPDADNNAFKTLERYEGNEVYMAKAPIL